jgi:N-acetylglucosamine kinase-like BadF-type ATPase
MRWSSGALVLGVDGGNSKTVAVVATSDGEVIGAGRGGCADIYNAESETAALDAIRAAVEDALVAAEVTTSDLAAGAFSLAGADWPEDLNLLKSAVDRFQFGGTTTVVNDAIGALRAGTPDGIGVAMACGTGIAVGARNATGNVWYSGHWPVAWGGSELGQRALRAVYEAHLGLAPGTTLTEAIQESFGVSSVEEVLYRCTARGATWTWKERARLAPVLLDQAARGDEVARSIVVDAARRNADVAMVAAEAVGLASDPFRVVLTGGVLRHPACLMENEIRRHLAGHMPNVAIVDDAPEPVVGAVLLAMELAERKPDDALLERLLATLPGPEFFAT